MGVYPFRDVADQLSVDLGEERADATADRLFKDVRFVVWADELLLMKTDLYNGTDAEQQRITKHDCLKGKE